MDLPAPVCRVNTLVVFSNGTVHSKIQKGRVHILPRNNHRHRRQRARWPLNGRSNTQPVRSFVPTNGETACALLTAGSPPPFTRRETRRVKKMKKKGRVNYVAPRADAATGGQRGCGSWTTRAVTASVTHGDEATRRRKSNRLLIA